MKGILYLLLSFFAGVFLVACQPTDIFDQDGHLVQLLDHPNKWMIVHYWAPWCPACRRELPELNAFYLAHRAHVLIYGFDYDDLTQTQLITLRMKMGIDFPLLAVNPVSVLHLEDEIQGLPMSFVYNPKGDLVKILRGPQTIEDLERVIQ